MNKYHFTKGGETFAFTNRQLCTNAAKALITQGLANEVYIVAPEGKPDFVLALIDGTIKKTVY